MKSDELVAFEKAFSPDVNITYCKDDGTYLPIDKNPPQSVWDASLIQDERWAAWQRRAALTGWIPIAFGSMPPINTPVLLYSDPERRGTTDAVQVGWLMNKAPNPLIAVWYLSRYGPSRENLFTYWQLFPESPEAPKQGG